MDFKTLDESLPYVTGGTKHILEYEPYFGITLRFPGKHALDTEPVGGDFVVCVDDEQMRWNKHQFTHVDLFNDLGTKIQQGAFQDLMQKDATLLSTQLMAAYFKVVQGKDPDLQGNAELAYLPGIRASTFLRAVQCLAVAEHRRYHQFEVKYGGRYLPFRFAAGIVEGCWEAKDATAMHRKGRPGVEMLEKTHGLPTLTKQLISGN